MKVEQLYQNKLQAELYTMAEEYSKEEMERNVIDELYEKQCCEIHESSSIKKLNSPVIQ